MSVRDRDRDRGREVERENSVILHRTIRAAIDSNEVTHSLERGLIMILILIDESHRIITATNGLWSVMKFG